MKNKIFSAMLILLSVLLVTSCATDGLGGENPTGGSETTASGAAVTTGPEEPVEALPNLVFSAEQNYCIAVKSSDADALAFAERLQAYLSETAGLSLPIKPPAYLSETAPAIRIGRDMIADAGDGLELRTDDRSLYLYAADAEGYQLLEVVLKSRFLYNKGVLEMKSNDSFSLSAAQFGTRKYGDRFELDFDADYTLVYSAADDADGSVTASFAALLSKLTGLQVTAGADTEEYDREILFGSVDREQSRAFASRVNEVGGYAVGVTKQALLLSGETAIDRVYALLTLAELVNAAENPRLYESDSYFSATANRVTHSISVPTATAAYRKAYGTYHSYVDRDTDALSAEGKRQILLNEMLVEYLGEGFVVMPGSSSALYDGFVVKLDTADYSKKTYVNEGELFIAAEFARSYFGESVTVTADGHCNLSACLAASNAYRLLYKEAQGIYLILPITNTAFDNDTDSAQGVTVKELLDRMAVLFDNPIRPEPENNNVEQTRVVIDEVEFDPNLIYDFTVQGHETLYSPGICAVWENGTEILYVSYEKCTATMMDMYKEEGSVTYLCRSTDGGNTWETIGAANDLKWASIFEYQGDVYLMGTNLVASAMHMAKYDVETGIFSDKIMEGLEGGGGAPCAVIKAAGRIWRATTRVYSAAIGSDLMKESSWTVTARADSVFTKSDFLSAMGLSSVNKYSLGEGNIVVKPDGNVYAVFPISAAPTHGYFAVLRVSEDGTSLSELPDGKTMMTFPSTNCKASIRYDEKTQLYVALTTLSTTGAQTWYESSRRNVLGIAVSSDMENWTVLDVLLVDREIMSEDLSKLSHAYQYADFVFSGENLRIVIREAAGVTSTYHDGKYITLYTLENYAEWIEERMS